MTAGQAVLAAQERQLRDLLGAGEATGIQLAQIGAQGAEMKHCKLCRNDFREVDMGVVTDPEGGVRTAKVCGGCQERLLEAAAVRNEAGEYHGRTLADRLAEGFDMLDAA